MDKRIEFRLSDGMSVTYERIGDEVELTVPAKRAELTRAVQELLLEIDRLRAQQDAPTDAEAQDAEEDAYVIDRMSKLLAGVAVALKGPEKARHRHGYQDLPDLAVQVMAQLQKLRQDAEREGAKVQILSDQLAHERAHNERLLKILVGIHNLTMPPLVEANGMRYQFTPPDAVEWLYRLTERIKAIPEEIDAARAQRAAAQGDSDA